MSVILLARAAALLVARLTRGSRLETHGPFLTHRQHTTYSLMGVVLAVGAPLGLLSLRRFVLKRPRPILQDVRDDSATYLYLATITPVAFGLFGRVLGRRAERLVAMSTTDALTGLANRRAFYPRLERELERSRRSHLPASLLLLDVDCLKTLNDQHGHAAGDRALENVAQAIGRALRSCDVAARLGGDEFAVFAPDTGSSPAQALAERLKAAINAKGASSARLPLSASIGVVTFDPAHDRPLTVGGLMQATDRALYAAKRSGRNRIAHEYLDRIRPGTERETWR